MTNIKGDFFMNKEVIISYDNLQKVVNSLRLVLLINNKSLDLLDPDKDSEFKDNLEDNLLNLYMSLISVNSFICSIYDSLEIEKEVPDE